MTKRVLIWIALVVSTPIAYAQPTSSKKAAEAAYQEGRRLYDLREWDQAIAKFKEAYKLRPDPPALFNIAQSYRLKGDCIEAQNFYRTYKRNFPNEPNIARVEKFITELEACAKQQAAAKAAPATPEAPAKPGDQGRAPEAPVKTDLTVTNPDPAKTEPTKTEPTKIEPTKIEPTKIEPTKTEPTKTEPTKPDPTKVDSTATKTEPIMPPETKGDRIGPEPTTRPGRTKRIAGLAMIGIGTGAAIGGVVFGLKARATARDAENAMPGTVWTPELESRGQRHAKISVVLIGAAAVGIVGGGVLYALGRRSDEPISVAVVPDETGASLVWSGRLP